MAETLTSPVLDEDAVEVDASTPPPPPLTGSAHIPKRQLRKNRCLETTEFDERIDRVMNTLRQSRMTDVESDHCDSTVVSEAVNAIMAAAKRHTWQQTKSFKHRAQVEAIAAQCLKHLPEKCEKIVELGAGQAILGHAISISCGLPLVAIERRGNTETFEISPDEIGSSPLKHVPEVHRVQCDIADDDALPQEGNVALIAKHLCAHGIDIAIDAAVRLGDRLSLVCLAPCCHSKMCWDTWTDESRQWLQEDAGFSGGAEDFALLCDMVRLSRVGGKEPGKPVPCAKWRLRQRIAADEIKLLGRRACQIINEARLHRLRSAGLEVRVVEYCVDSLSPDNVLLLARPSFSAPLLLPQHVQASDLPRRGVVLELDPKEKHSVQQRLTSFLHEQLSLFPSLRSVASIGDFETCQAPGILCILKDAYSLSDLVTELLACRLVTRTITRMLPYDTWDSDIALVAKAVKSMLSEGPSQRSVRVWARPRDLEKQICACLGPEELSTAGFTDSLFVSSVTCKPGDIAALCSRRSEDTQDEIENSVVALRFSLLPRSVIDVPGWTASRRQDTSCSRMLQRSIEVAIRWPHRFKDKSSVCIFSDVAEGCDWLEGFVDDFLMRGAAISELVFACQSGAVAPSLTMQCLRKASVEGTSAASVLFVERGWIGFGGTEAFSELEQVLTIGIQSGILAPTGVVVVKLRCGRSVRSIDAWYRDTARWFQEKLGALHVELLHLLADKEQERTALLNWDKSLLPSTREPE